MLLSLLMYKETLNTPTVGESVGLEVSAATEDALRKGQRPLLDDVYAYLNSHDPSEARGYVVAPTGSGKTVIFSRMLHDQMAKGVFKPTIIVAPTKQIVTQTLEQLEEHRFPGSFDKVVGWREDTGEQDILVATNKGFTDQVLNSWGRAINPKRYGQLIIDEAHHLQGPKIREAIAKMPHAAVLGFTATPDYDEQRQLSRYLPDLIHEISISEAVDSGLIAPFTTLLFETKADMRDVAVSGADFDQVALEKALDVPERNRRIASFAAEHFTDEIMLFNTSTVAHAEHLAGNLRETGILTEAVHGGMTDRQQKDILKRFKEGNIQAVTQARLLGEGYDNPRIEVVFNTSPTLSAVKAKQRTGRGGRIDPDNKDKIMLVVECVDTKYRKMPLLYGDESVAGTWQQGIDQNSTNFLERVKKLQAVNDSRLTVEAEEIEEVYKSVSSPKKRIPVTVIPFVPKTPECRQYPDSWFFLGRGESSIPAKIVCATCVEIKPCLDYAVRSNVQSGIFGGYAQRPRRKVRKILQEHGETEYEKELDTLVKAVKVKFS